MFALNGQKLEGAQHASERAGLAEAPRHRCVALQEVRDFPGRQTGQHKIPFRKNWPRTTVSRHPSSQIPASQAQHAFISPQARRNQPILGSGDAVNYVMRVFHAHGKKLTPIRIFKPCFLSW
jgi:hypothetical protein